MTSIEQEMKKLYPFWNSLIENEKQIVEDIAMQLPISCEDVAHIFVINDGSIIKTLDYLKREYSFSVNTETIRAEWTDISAEQALKEGEVSIGHNCN